MLKGVVLCDIRITAGNSGSKTFRDLCMKGGVPPEVFFALSFAGRFSQGAVAFHIGYKAGSQEGVTGTGASRRV
jgi:hypothetical protein